MNFFKGLIKNRKNREKKSVEENREAEDIVLMKRMISHNVRMPMAVISGYGELLRQGLLSEAEKEKCILNICENISYMNQIFKVLLDDESGAVISPGPVDVVELVYKMKNYVRDIASKIPININIEAAKPQLFIRAETIPVMKILYQLFDNAFKYLQNGNTVQIRLHPVGDDQVMIVFKDDGPGVEKADLTRIFEEGYRGKNKNGKPGNGFGLYNVKRTVEAYNGTVSASGDSGKGFSIVMMFPMMEKNPDRPDENL